MRIAIFIPGFQTDEDDWCIPAFTNLGRELSRHADVEVFALRHPASRSTYTVGKVRVHALGGGSFGRVRVPGLSLLKLWVELLHTFSRVHRKRRFDAVIGIWGTEAGALACVAGKRAGLPVLVHLAGGELVRLRNIGYGNSRRGLSGALVEHSLRDADLITYPSDYMKRLLDSRKSPVASTRCAYWPLGVDTALFAHQTYTEAADPFTFITAASLLPVKGLELLIEASAHLHTTLPKKEFRVIITGEGPRRQALTEKISASNLEGYVVLTGEIKHDCLPAAFASARCFVMTSWHEAQCMALLEACAAGLPWIATPVGAAPDLARFDERSGILLSDRCPERLAEAMARMMDAPDAERAGMGSAASGQVLHSFDLRNQTSHLVALIEGLTASYPNRRMKTDSLAGVTGDVLSLLRDLAAISLSYPPH